MEQKKRKRKSKQEIAWVEVRKKRKHNKNEIIVSRTLISSQKEISLNNDSFNLEKYKRLPACLWSF